MFPFWRLKAPELICPGGEQITNGGFETGDFTGWPVGYGEVVTDHPHSGSYCAHLSYQEYRDQTLAEPVLVECIESFTCWIYGQDVLGQQSGISIIITYSDDTTIQFSEDAPNGSWGEVDILPVLEAHKYVKTIRVWSYKDTAYNLWVDDVSLIGRG